MLVISSSVLPSTSKSPLASMLLVNVAVSETLRVSKSVCPSTSRLPLASILPVNVDAPETFTSSSFVSPTTSNFADGIKLAMPTEPSTVKS